MTLTELENTVDIWIIALQKYDVSVLQTQPDSDNWSLGQVYLHILNDTNFYMEQAGICLSHKENQSEKKTEFAALLFSNNGFPDEKIEVDLLANRTIPQPTNKADLVEQMEQLKASLTSLWEKVSESSDYGKTKHPGLGYFNAREWLEFAEMHMRHHLRQKHRIEVAIET
ncbi:DinB superfamily protein [Flavisolibacter ginsengisoli DSM 18119]|jgi:hypothetical protein|uniref:DinB superfamily protein n=2 Tax=Flavisolibacter TaxID=398041 RepID=A0A1M5BT27_9BACT|nr:DinB superfamily protein [Flavisolibacter ginsengisoli DSM 18119]